MTVKNEAQVINEANTIVSRIQAFTNLKNLGCSLLLCAGSVVFMVLIIYRGVFEGVTIAFFVLMSFAMALMMVIQSVESWLAHSARDAFNARFPERIRGEERKVALNHIAALDSKNDAIGILLRELGYVPGKLESAPESQLANQLQQLDNPPDDTLVAPGASKNAILSAKHDAVPISKPVVEAPLTAPVHSARPVSIKPSTGKKVIPLDPFGDDN